MRPAILGALAAVAIWLLPSCSGDRIHMPYRCVTVAHHGLSGGHRACCGYVCGVSGDVEIPASVDGMEYQYSIIAAGHGAPLYEARGPDPMRCEVLLAAVYCGD